MVQKGGKTTTEAHAQLKGTFSKDKNELLFSQFGINYNSEPDVYKRGTILIRIEGYESKKKQTKKEQKGAAPL